MPIQLNLAAFAAALLVAAGAAAAEAPPAWVQFAADGALSPRTVVARNAACPAVTADGSPVAMQPRGTPDERFPIKVCEARLPVTAAKLAIGTASLPTVPAEIKRIVVLGDTGCRIEGRAVQDCNDPAAWPFRLIAAKAAGQKPDLIVHLGDYYYREAACPAGRAGCAGSPHGDNWPAWQAEFFVPTGALLSAAPWVMVRGNHELCRRGGIGWFRLLDPHPFASACTDRTESYPLAFGGLSLLLFDGAEADDFLAPPDKVAFYGGQLAKLLDNAPPHSWLVTHRPFWALAGGELTGMALNLTEQQAVRDKVPPGLDLVMAGHLHNFAAFAFGPERPAQMIVGTGGDTLLDLARTPLVGAEIDGMPIVKGFALKTFGYFVLDRTADGWEGVLRAVDDTILAHCRLSGRDLQCR
jgi:hypothetical protein